MSPYQYTRNNPINRFDPDGFVDRLVVGKGITEFFSGVYGMVSGTLAIAGGGTATYGSGGAASPITVPTIVWGVAQFSIGGLTAGVGIADIIQGIKDKPALSLMQKVGSELGISKEIVDAVNLSLDILNASKIPKEVMSTEVLRFINALISSGNLSVSTIENLKNLEKIVDKKLKEQEGNNKEVINERKELLEKEDEEQNKE